MQHLAYFNYIDALELDDYVVYACSHSGDCEEDIKRCKELPEVRQQLDAIDKEALKSELKEYGAWDSDQLEDHEENKERILWIAACNINDEL